MKKTSGIIFDVDGTLVDSNHQHAMAWLEAFQAAGLDVAYHRIRRLIGKGSDKLFPELTGESLDSPEGKAISEDCKRIFKQKYLPQIRAFDQADALVRRLRQSGLKLAVASSARREDLEALLKIAGSPELLETSTTSKEADRSKPDPDIVAAALEKLGTPPDETIMIGDTPYDIESATRAGVGVIAFRCGGWGDDHLQRALAIYDDPADLLAHFDRSPFAA
jgi:HAD superfamily hydrolase (TIGR01509 family)